MLRLNRLTEDELVTFVKHRGLDHAERRARLANGCPGAAAALDLEVFDKRRAAMLNLLEVASRRAAFGSWLKHAESISASKSEKLDYYLEVLYTLLEDLLLLSHGFDNVRNPDLAPQLKGIADAVDFRWLRRAVELNDEMVRLIRRNIQKGIALDAFALELRDMVNA
jgi:DNA polymerase-3 subunit delta'